MILLRFECTKAKNYSSFLLQAANFIEAICLQNQNPAFPGEC